MKIVSDNVKNALKQPTTQRKGKILVDGNYYEVYNVEYYADSYEDGNVIGNAIASQLDFDLPYMDKFDSFKYFDGVWTGNDYEYVNMGTFTVFDEQDEDEFNKHITAFDNLIKFNKPFEEVGTYPKTLYEELQNICQQAGVELVNATIPNGKFQIENNQFVNGETLKTVLKAICQISGNYGIIKEDKLVLQLINDTSETIVKNQHEPVIWKRKTYGINQVILQLGDVDGEYVIRQDDEDIAENGIHKLVVTNNPFAYTQDKRDALIDELFNQVRGFGYIPYEMNCEWLNYLDIGDKITIDGIETLVLRIQGKSPTGLESFISAPAIIDSATEYVDNTNSIKNQISRTEIIVDKQNKTIQSIASKVEDISKIIIGSGSITLENAFEGELHKLTIKGNISLNYPNNNTNLFGFNLLASENLVPRETLVPTVGVPYNNDILYPSNNLYPKVFKLKVDEKIYELDINYLNYMTSNICDEFIYKTGECYIIRRIGINENGEMYQLENEIIEKRKNLFINILENSTITLLGFGNAILRAEYLLQNQYSEVFASEAYVKSEIKQTADEINIEVAKKVNENEVVNQINVSTEQILLKGNRVVIESDKFDLDADGKITATAGEIGGFDMNSQSFSKKLTGIYDYNQFDIILTAMSILNRISIDNNLTDVLDVNNDNNITAVDYATIKKIINDETKNTKTLNGYFEINSSDPKNCISIKNYFGDVIASLGLGGINSTYVTCNNFVCGYPSESAGDFIGTTINGNNGNVTCVTLTQTSKEEFKKNFEILNNALDIIKATDIYKYHLINQEEDEKKHIGFVIGNNYNYSNEITSPNNDGADIYSMVSVCFKAIKEQQEQIENLKEEIKNLKEMIK